MICDTDGYLQVKLAGLGLPSGYDFVVLKDGSTYYALDGSTGSTASSNASISTVLEYAITNGKNIAVMPGTYTITSPIDVPVSSEDISLIGGGSGTWADNGATIFQQGANGNILNIDGSVLGTMIHKFTVQGIKFYNSGRSYTGNAIEANYCNCLQLIDCGFRSITDYAIYLNKGCYAPIIERCRFQHCGDNTTTGDENKATIYMVGDSGNDKITTPIIDKCVFEADHYRSIQCSVICTNAKIINNAFETGGDELPEVGISGSFYRGSIINNIFYDLTNHVCTAIQVSQDCKIINNYLYAYQIGIIGSDKQIIAFNNLYDSSQYGIRHGGDFAIIKGNQLLSCGTDSYAGIRLQGDAKHNIITSNQILECGTDGIILIAGCDRNIISKNMICDNASSHTDDCIDVRSDNNLISDNMIYDFYDVGNALNDTGAGNTDVDNIKV